MFRLWAVLFFIPLFLHHAAPFPQNILSPKGCGTWHPSIPTFRIAEKAVHYCMIARYSARIALSFRDIPAKRRQKNDQNHGSKRFGRTVPF